ncbi:MAG: ATP-binding cassette domain-containing protein [Anaerolineae bacterium]|nr:ATP-binding cassette domain-containing protein [Anaerolineae bacterium]
MEFEGMIEVNDLTKSYGAIQALRGIRFSVDSGQIVGLLGPNGAGKSTTIKILTGFLHPDEGSVQIDGIDVVEQTQLIQQRIGYLSENTPLYPSLSVQAYLKLMADLRGIPEADQPRLISDAIRAAGLVDYRARRISQLSKGLRQRVGLAQAILHKPKLLILDEPTVGLDPTQIVEIRQLIRRLASTSTILFSSHILSEVEALCDRVVIIIDGQVKADSRLDDLAASNNTIVVLQEPVEDAAAAMQALANVQSVDAFQTRDGFPGYRLVSDMDLAPLVYDLARQRDWRLRELRHDRVTLESVFNQLAMSA